MANWVCSKQRNICAKHLKEFIFTTEKINIMRKILLISLLLMLSAGFSHAQCGMNEVELRVEIMTDGWGYETSWILSDLLGAVVMQGGQNGAYQNNTSYSDSICVLSNECLFFEIYDTFGDGILAPGGCELYLDEVLVFSAANDIESYAMTNVNCWDSCSMVLGALNDLKAYINAIIPLSGEELTMIRNVFTLFPECLAGSESVLFLSKSVVEDYDNEIGALFTTPTTENGFAKDTAAAPGMEIERAMFALQQGIFDQIFTPEVYAEYPQHINGWIFNSCYAFPGYVDPPADSSTSHSVIILANFEDPDGMNPYFDSNGDGTAHALRPTGLYLSPGSIASVTVPDSLVDQDYYIRVGSHEWDLTERTYFKRFDRISKKFPINTTSTVVFNPFGGAISVLVPYGADDGIVEISLSNGVEAPFYSLKSFYVSPDFYAEINKPGPWAVFETENVMFTIPTHSIVPGQYDLMQAMLDWESAVRGVNSILARQIIPDKHNMYMIADIDIRYGAYSVGYPLSNTPLNFTNVPGTAYFINGPGPDDEVNFHETGHALAISKFPGEEEALVNVPYIMAMNYGLSVDLNEAVSYSFGPNTFNIDKTATHRMVSNTFGSERDISNTTTDEVRYQHRGYGHYFEIVNMLGWCPLRNFWKQEFIDFENEINHGINDQDIDSRIVRMSVAAHADLRPLFHVFGILPQDSIAVQDTLALIGVPPSLTVYNRLQDYFDLIPEDNAAFINYALSVYPDLYTNGPIEDPDFGVGWHYQKSLTYDAAEAQDRTDILQSIIDLYYPDGEPTGNGDPDVCCLLDTMNINLVNEEIIVTGGVPPYNISIDTTGNVLTVTVVDCDGCESTAQFIITSISKVITGGLCIFPNPTTGLIHIDFGMLQDQVTISTMDLTGKLIKSQTMVTTKLVSYRLPETAGVYIIKITYTDGNYQSFRIVKE